MRGLYPKTESGGGDPTYNSISNPSHAPDRGNTHSRRLEAAQIRLLRRVMAGRGTASRASRADALAEQVHSVDRGGERRRRERGAREGSQSQSSSKHPEGAQRQEGAASRRGPRGGLSRQLRNKVQLLYGFAMEASLLEGKGSEASRDDAQLVDTGESPSVQMPTRSSNMVRHPRERRPYASARDWEGRARPSGRYEGR